MAEYSRLASGTVISTGGATTVIVPFIPNWIAIDNQTRLVAGAGVTSASWTTDLGQGGAFLSTFGTGAQTIGPTGSTGLTSGGLTAGTGFTTVQAALALQYGPTFKLGGSGGIVSTSATVTTVTTTAAHGLVSGNVVVFQNLYQTSTTGMQQFAGIPFVVTVTSPTVFTIDWNASGANYTTIATGGLNGNAAFKQVLYPALYAPGVAFIAAITLGPTTAVTTTAPHNFFVGQEIAFRIPTIWGTFQLNSLPNLIIPGSPIYGFVTAVGSSTTFTVNINSSAYTAFNPNQTFASFPGELFPQVVAVGDVNSGGFPFTGGNLYPSPTVYNGTSTAAVSTINGPAIQGAYFNATYQGFIIGSGIAGSAADVIYWRAYLHDLNT